ncbi:hypothetical protein [Alteraurantiacibacter palmitatis]|uniref:META domain-containing protein n=1 Tax=Alteraurantiacibacter palmitatis TaxID=2054628 RepID=A0ABV7E8E8_9SPHN
MRALPALAVILLAACSQQAAPPPPAVTEGDERPAAMPLAEVATLAGEWRVAGIDGEELNETYGIALSASDAEIWAEPRCAGMVLAYRIDGLRYSSAQAGAEISPSEAGNPPPPICAIAMPPRVADVFTALREADTIGRTPANGIAISGPDRSVLLFSQ